MSDTVTISGELRGFGKGTIKVKVLNVCDDKPIEKAQAMTSGRKAHSDKSGIAVLKKLPENNHSVRVTKTFPEADYFTFLMHYPKAIMPHKAESKERIDVKLGKAETKEVETKLKVFRVVKKIVFKRIYIHPSRGKNLSGHWWVEIYPQGKEAESYGWYPKYQPGDIRNDPFNRREKPKESNEVGTLEKIGFLFKSTTFAADKIKDTVTDCFKGVEGELNGITSYEDGTPTRDPHQGDEADDTFNLVIDGCDSDEVIFNNIREFASTHHGQWSWRFEMFGNNNCHEFQIKMMKEKEFKYFRDVK